MTKRFEPVLTAPSSSGPASFILVSEGGGGLRRKVSESWVKGETVLTVFHVHWVSGYGFDHHDHLGARQSGRGVRSVDHLKGSY